MTTKGTYQGHAGAAAIAATILARLARTEPKGRAGREVLAWLTASAEYVGPPA